MRGGPNSMLQLVYAQSTNIMKRCSVGLMLDAA